MRRSAQSRPRTAPAGYRLPTLAGLFVGSLNTWVATPPTRIHVRTFWKYKNQKERQTPKPFFAGYLTSAYSDHLKQCRPTAAAPEE